MGTPVSLVEDVTCMTLQHPTVARESREVCGAEDAGRPGREVTGATRGGGEGVSLKDRREQLSLSRLPSGFPSSSLPTGRNHTGQLHTRSTAPPTTSRDPEGTRTQHNWLVRYASKQLHIPVSATATIKEIKETCIIKDGTNKQPAQRTRVLKAR
ncbi:hypothetical protein DPEC_G00254090 [Dallia pectoralis]|uniref:Uncharacterized protein n=1 Tax=Dallia pectoralis TaxID=75939 RepID=A0ACC2FTV7_DALPE|nr:hypothetical protein DPEC_G00254090 [Dallia pectoralis]